MVIIGGGLAGLSVGCYARMNGWRTRILEHNIGLGGVCTAWARDPYLVDGCIPWLMGGAPGGMFRRIYEELGIVPQVELRPLDLFARYENRGAGWGVDVGRDMEELRTQLREIAPEDAEEIDRLIESIEHVDVGALPNPELPPELTTLPQRLMHLWEMRHLAGTMLHYRGSLADWTEARLASPKLREVLVGLLGKDMPALFVPMLLHQLREGQLSRPVGGSARLRDAIVERYAALGGEVTTNTTVDEVVVEHDTAVGVRISDGTTIPADVVVSTSSAHETAMRLLGGRYVDGATRERLETWKTFPPVLLLSLGVAKQFEGTPSTLVLREREPVDAGGHTTDRLYVGIHDDSSFAPHGHCVVQVMVDSDFDWWAARGSRYGAEKDRVSAMLVERLDHRLPGLAGHVRMIDLATPLTFWRHARSWKGAYEGWLPTPDTVRTHVPKQLPGLDGLWLAGQWVEPGGGVPTALMSGRQLVQILCDRNEASFTTKIPPRAA